MEVFPQSRIIYFSVTMWTVASSLLSPSAFCLLTRSNIQKTFSSSEGIMSVPVLTEYTDSTMNVSLVSLLKKYNNPPRI
jgi:hypothetical protein